MHDLNDLPHVAKPTSKTTAQAMAKPAIRMRMRILRHLVEIEPHGSTCDAAQRWLELTHQSNSPRFTELVDDKLIYDTGEQRPTLSGHPAIVYRPTSLGIQAVTSGWYQGDRIIRQRRVSRMAEMRDALTEALNHWTACVTGEAHVPNKVFVFGTPTQQLERIKTLRELAKPSPRRRARQESETP